MMKEFLLMACLTVFVGFASAQTEIIIADFDSEKIDSLNQRQHKQDSISHSFHLEELESMESGKAFLPDVPKIDQRKSIQNTKIMYRRYGENLAKQHLIVYSNDSIEHKTEDDFYSPTICWLQNDSLSIAIVNNIFGGFNSELILNQNTFSSTFTMDSYREKVFMTDSTDTTLLSVIQVGMKDALLTLKRPLDFDHGEKITGLFTFSTNDFYRVSDYDPYLVLDDHSTENPDRITVDGSILFKCRVVDLGLIEEY